MQFIQRLAFVLAVLCSACLSIAADIYVNASSTSPVGNDSNAGTSAAPYLTLGKVTSVIASGDTVYLAGEFQGGSGATNLEFNGFDNVTIVQWQGMPQAWLKNSVSIARGSAWAAATAPRYQTTIATGLSLQTVSVAFGDPAFTDANGRFKGHLELAASAADVITNDDSFWYDSGTGVLSINVLNASTDPDTYLADVEYCLSGLRTGGDFVVQGEGCNNCTVRGIKGRNYIITNQAGYFVFLSGTGNVIEDCEFFNTGWHHVGFVASSSSVVNINNTIRRCTFWGGATGTGGSSGTQTVFYANGSNVIGGEINDCTYHSYRLVTPGAKDWGAVDMDGSYCHTNGSSYTAQLTHRRCKFYTYTGGRGASGGNLVYPTAAVTDDHFRVGAYSLKFFDCQWTARHVASWTGTRGIYLTQAAYVRCLLQNMTLKNDTRTTAGAGRAFENEFSSDFRLPTLFESSHLVCDLSGGSGPPADIAGLNFNNNSNGGIVLTMVNSSFVNNNTTAGITNTRLFNPGQGGTTALFRFRGSVFCASTTGTLRNLFNSATLTAANYDAKQNMYFGVSTTAYTNNSAINSAAEWLASVDTGAVQAVDPGYYPAGTTQGAFPEPVAGAEVVRRTHMASPRSTLGINYAKDGQRFGPWQTGASTVGVVSTRRPFYIFD